MPSRFRSKCERLLGYVDNFTLDFQAAAFGKASDPVWEKDLISDRA